MEEQESKYLIIDFSKGREYAFRYIYDKYVPVLRLFAHKYLSDDILVDDIVQDAFVKLWESRRSFEVENTIKSFLYSTVKNKCLNLLRHAKVKYKHSESLANEDNEESFIDNIIEAEVFKQLMEVFEELPPSCKAVYRMSIDGFKHDEIAKELGISINTVKKHKNNANRYMREKLKNLFVMIVFIIT